MDNYLDFSDIKISRQEILSELGYRNTIPEAFILDLIDDLCYELKDIVQARYFFEIYQGKVDEKHVILDNGLNLNVGPVISSLLLGASSFAFFIATAGSEFESFMHRINREGDILISFIANAIGSCIAEKTGDIMESDLKAIIGDMNHTNRFSPGYCDWTLPEQKKIFSLLKDNTCGVTLSNSFLMNPIKSISGVVGIGANVKRKKYGCDFCENKTCYKRKKRI